MEKLDDFTLNLLTNDEVIEINQDPLRDGNRSLRWSKYRIYVSKLHREKRIKEGCGRKDTLNERCNQ
jgi:alpha-galactosidase